MSDAAIRRLAGRIRLSIGRAVLGLVNDAAKLQAVQVQLQADVVRDRVEHFQHYGFTSAAHPGAEGIYLAIGGSTDHVVVINIDDRRYRLKSLAEGEVAIYDDQGQKVHLTRNGIVVDGGGKQMRITNTPKVRMECALDVTGDIKDRCDLPEGKTMSGMRTTYNGHNHNDPQGGAVGAPNQQM